MFGCTIPAINSPNNLTVCAPNGNASEVGLWLQLRVLSKNLYCRQPRSFLRCWDDSKTNVRTRVRKPLSTLDSLSFRKESQVGIYKFFKMTIIVPFLFQGTVQTIQLVMPKSI